ncbi:MAG: Hpt domain-containing protein [Steroidobacteraceae bacterium]|nr:Hpt domain-containing protein [Steroidobacteraceae bacterium]
MLAHRLKGAAGSYGFPEITRQAALLESAVRGGVTTDAVACELASLEAICAAARRA